MFRTFFRLAIGMEYFDINVWWNTIPELRARYIYIYIYTHKLVKLLILGV